MSMQSKNGIPNESIIFKIYVCKVNIPKKLSLEQSYERENEPNSETDTKYVIQVTFPYSYLFEFQYKFREQSSSYTFTDVYSDLKCAFFGSTGKVDEDTVCVQKIQQSIYSTLQFSSVIHKCQESIRTWLSILCIKYIMY